MAVLSKMPKYDAYKSSELMWLGSIPSHWDVERSQWLFKLRREKARKGDEQLTASQKYGMIAQQTFMELEGRRVTQVEFNPEILKHVEADDFVISMRSFQGGIEYCHQSGSVSSAYVPLIPHKYVNSSYFKYLLKSPRYIEALQSTSNLVRDGQALRYENFKMVSLPVVPIEEQVAIANFLDAKTAQIDEAISIKEKQIELLKERKQIIIQQAVTQGFNPDVPMKDSGMDWIGEIPEHWTVTRVKHATRIISKGTTPSTIGRGILEEGEIRFIKAENLVEGSIIERPLCFIDKKTNELLLRSSLQVGDVLFVIAGATLGKTAVVSEKIYPANTNQAVAFLRPNNLIEPTYLPLWLSSNFTSQLIWLDAVQSAQPNLSMEDLGNFSLLLPPKTEQIDIINNVSEKTKRVDEAIGLQMSQINSLKEYKATLINSAVTGKIKVV